MRRRRDRRAGDTFGTSLADILTTALGCVVLLFLVAVTRIKTSLSAEQAAHVTTQARLTAQEEGRRRAEVEQQVERGRRSAIEQALDDARSRAEALQGEKDRLATQLASIEAQQIEAQASLARSQERVTAVESAARDALRALDPHTAAPVDVMLVIDGTRSMQDSLDATRRNLRAMVAALRVVSPTARVGVVVFRDKYELPAVRLQEHALTGDEAALEAFLAGIEATSTARDKDRPEWLCGGIAAAERAGWRAEALRLMIVVSDADAQDPGARQCLEVAARFRRAGGRLSVMSTKPTDYGKRAKVNREYERVVLPQHRRIAEAGGGTHVGQAEADALLVEVLQSAFRSRTADPLEQLRRAVGPAEPAGPEPAGPEPAGPPAPTRPGPAGPPGLEDLRWLPRDDAD